VETASEFVHIGNCGKRTPVYNITLHTLRHPEMVYEKYTSSQNLLLYIYCLDPYWILQGSAAKTVWETPIQGTI
jgi:hypothetical protein